MDRFTAVYAHEDDWWIAYVEELPGTNTQAHTLDEARENLKEAVLLIVEGNRESAGNEVVREELVLSAG